MTQTIQRFFVPSYGPGHADIKKSFGLVLQICELKNFSRLTLLVTSKTDFINSAFSTFIGENFTRRLYEGEQISLSDKLSMDFKTLVSIDIFAEYDLVLGLYLSEQGLSVLDSLKKPRAIAYLPWLNEPDAWINTWTPVILGETPATSVHPPIDPLVEQSLKQLIAVVPLPAGLTHRFARELAEDILQKLYDQDRPFDPGEIKRWAVQHGWPPEQAVALAELAARINNL